MNNLKRDNIIEFESRMIQFHGAQKSKVDSNIPKCPTCDSTNIEKFLLVKKL